MTEVDAFYVSGNNSSRSSLEKYGHYLDNIFFTGLEITGDCKIVKSNYNRGIKHLLSEIKRERIFSLLSNYRLAPEESNKILEKVEAWPDLYKNIYGELQKFNLEGVNLNLEGVKKQNKNRLIDFVQSFVAFLERKDMRLTLSLPAKAERNGSEWAGAYDYYILGDIADYVVIMAYDYHWVNGPPGAIAPYHWVQTVIDYAIMEIPAENLRVALPFYGYDWPLDTGESAKGLSYRQVMELKNDSGALLEWDQEACCPYFCYRCDGVEHEVWFENKKSLLLKVELIKEYGLGGVAFWRLGLEDPDIWDIFG
ncbi:MAG: glycosyl hydrolase family 18 protein [Halanaerobiaceae bacterium]